MLRAQPRLYLHGTPSRDAVRSLLAGGRLRPRAADTRGRFPASRPDLVYLTTCFYRASEYAYNCNRDDWDETPIRSEQCHVFGFELADVAVQPEEDELGWAVRLALRFAAGEVEAAPRREDGVLSVPSCGVTGSLLFCRTVSTDIDLLRDLAAAATPLLTASERFAELLRPHWPWDGRDCTRVGLHLAGRLPEPLLQRLIDHSMSVAVSAALAPAAIACWRWPRQGPRPFPMGISTIPETGVETVAIQAPAAAVKEAEQDDPAENELADDCLEP